MEEAPLAEFLSLVSSNRLVKRIRAIDEFHEAHIGCNMAGGSGPAVPARACPLFMLSRTTAPLACGADACTLPVKRLRIGTQKFVLVMWIFHRKVEHYVIG